MAWLSGWSYRKEITITGQSGAGTNYQVDLDIGDSAGGDFHLEGHCTNFPQDIEVTDNDETTLLDFWIEDITADPLKMWIEVADDLGSNQTIYIYYGKSGATTNSSIDDTFLFGDDFPGDTLDGNKWNEWVSAGSYSVSNSILQITGAAAGWEIIGAKTQFSPNVILEFYGKFDEQDITGISIDDRSATGSHAGTGVDGAQYSYDTGDGVKLYRTIRENADTNNSRTSTLTSYTNLKMVWLSGSVAFYEDNVLKDTISTNVPADDCGAQVQAYGSTSDVYLDWVFVRKYAATEPSFSSAGSEETSPVTGNPYWYYQMLRRRN